MILYFLDDCIDVNLEVFLKIKRTNDFVLHDLHDLVQVILIHDLISEWIALDPIAI